MKLSMPLMNNNITREDRDVLIEFLKGDPILTQSTNVKAFEKEWSQWLGVKYSVFVNSGSSANFITMNAIKQIYGQGEVIVPTLTWVSDVASVINAGLKPVFVDINERHLGMDCDQILSKITSQTRAVFLTHVLGFNALSDRLLKELEARKIPLIEDVCESHGATFKGKKLGSYGLASNFSFYYAHHMTTIEGGMICTNDEKIYEVSRLYRSHGMVREATSEDMKNSYIKENPELNPEFIFAYPGFNMRSTEINAVLGRNQLKSLDANNEKRTKNFKLFLSLLDAKKYRTDFDIEGSVNYALTLVIKDGNPEKAQKVMANLKEAGVEFRRGLSGGGSQIRQPYLRGYVAPDDYKKFPKTDYVHFYGFYIGNFPSLEEQKINDLCQLLNRTI
ncbi:MAG: aminotransferase class I/II-fold pyridoxal phosphate-dependent enzyme [Pseudomonadota bacterium]|nr:aminotransferase class I/II-fold pyridoxal phosphate-dependent enzyme [Pseudomonadota bacterium]